MTIFEWRRLQLDANADDTNQPPQPAAGLKRMSRHLTPIRADADESQKQVAESG